MTIQIIKANIEITDMIVMRNKKVVIPEITVLRADITEMTGKKAVISHIITIIRNRRGTLIMTILEKTYRIKDRLIVRNHKINKFRIRILTTESTNTCLQLISVLSLSDLCLNVLTNLHLSI